MLKLIRENWKYVRWANVFAAIAIPFMVFCVYSFCHMIYKSFEDYQNRTETYHLTATVVKVKYEDVYTERHSKRRHTYYPVLVEDVNGVRFNYVFDTYASDNWQPTVGTQVYKDCWTEVDGRKFCDSEWDEEFTYPSTTPEPQKKG